MSTNTHLITSAPRYCLVCDGAMVEAEEPSGAPCLQCQGCGHAVEPSTIEDSTLPAPRRPYQTLRRRMVDEALETATALQLAQHAAFCRTRQGQINALLAVIESLQQRNPARLRQLAA